MRLVALVTLALLATLAAAPANATIGTIQPGDKLNGGCTMNFVFDGVGPLAGRVFVGTAAHCVDADGVGAPVDSAPYDDFGTVAVIGSESTVPTDWALVEVKPEFHRFVKAAMKGHPGYPTGVATAGTTAAGDPIQFSGYGMVFDGNALTQEKRVGILLTQDADSHQFLGAASPGDSGGPTVHIPTGRALGLHRGPGSGATIEFMIAQAAAQGFPVQLRTV